MTTLFFLLLLASFLAIPALSALGANPYLPSWEYVPDGEPRVFGDRVYIYGSHDQANQKKFCDHKLVVWSAPLTDLNNWRYEGHSFHTRPCEEGHPTDVPWSTNDLYAPDVVENNGKYYLYAYVVGAPCAVAVSDSPAGPFKTISQIKAPPGSPNDFGGWAQYIDPGVLVDDDGQVYIYWGYKSSHQAKLDPKTMVDVLPGSYKADPIPVEKPYNFFEAASMRKIGDTYYLVYADGGILTYATSKNPQGPFAYGGHIIRNGRDYPGGNNHGSLCLINGQWYIFYHRMTNNTIFSRRACVERVTIKPDGSIDEVEQTSLGFEESLNPYKETKADIACILKHGPYITELNQLLQPIIHIKNGSVAGYKYFDFRQRKMSTTFYATLRPVQAAGTLEIWLDHEETGTKVGSVAIPAPATPASDHTTNPNPWIDVSVKLPPITGRHAVLFKFTSNAGDAYICDLKSFAFIPH